MGFVIADLLYEKFPEASEGQLTRLRASLVKGDNLAEIAKSIELASHLILGSGELKSGGWRRKSILANTLEAIIGAIYIDSDIQSCRNVIGGLFESHINTLNLDDIKKDPKSLLQEHLQSLKHSVPAYDVLKESGSSHNPEFTVSCKVEILDEVIVATGNSKRKAEQSAAEKVLNLLEAKK